MPVAEHRVAQGLDAGRMILPPLGIHCRERLGADDRPAVDVRGRGHFLGTSQIQAAHPEFAHRLVGASGVGDFVAGAAVGFDRKPQPILPGQLLRMAGIVLDHQVRDGLPQVPEESLRDGQALDHPAGHDGQVRQQVVTAPLLEFLPHPRRPVLRSVLPTIDVRGDQAGFRRPA